MATNPYGQPEVTDTSNPYGKPEVKPAGALRKAVGDKVVGFASGAVGATKAISDAAGAGNVVSNTLEDINKGINDYLSPEAKTDQQEQGAIMADAKGKGIWEGVKAGAQAFAVAPVQTAVQGLGSIVPILAGTALTGGAAPAAAVGAGIGVAMGAGTAKGAIFDDIKKRSLAGGMNEADASASATKAQEYTGANTDQIALGGALGAVDALTGVSRMAGNMARGALRKPVAEVLTNTTERGILGRAGMGMLSEMPLEAAQGGQEQVATNIAAQRAGFEAGTWDNVASNATLEALASAGPGAAFGALERAPTAPITPPAPGESPAPAGPALQIGNTPDPYISYADGMVARKSEADAYISGLPPEQQPAARAKIMGLAPQPSIPEVAPSADMGIPITETAITPIKPSEAMGLNPAAGPLSAAAVTAVDTGAHQEIALNEANTADQAAYEQATTAQTQQDAEQDTIDKPITTGPLAEAAMSDEDKRAILFSNKAVADGGIQYEGTQDGDILNGMGKPYPTRFAAQRRARMEGKDWTIATVFDGFVARRSEGKASAPPAAAVTAVVGNSSAQAPTEAVVESAPNTATAPADIAHAATETVAKPETLDDIATRAWAANYSKVTGDIQAASDKDIERADGYAAKMITGYQQAAFSGDQAAKDMIGSLQAEQEGFKQELQSRKNSTPAASTQSAPIGATPPVTQPAQPVMGEGAGGSQPTQAAPTKKEQAKADLDHLFGVDDKRAKAIERIAKGTAYFSKPLKAQEFIAKNGLKDTHKAVKTSETRWDIQAKDSQPQGSTNGTQTPQAVEAEAQGQTPERASGQPVADHIGRDNRPLSEGGKPFKTKDDAAEAKKLQPMLRVVKSGKGFVLAPKTDKQLAAEVKAAKRLSNPQTSPRGEPIPAHAFIASEGGLRRDTKSDMNIGINPRVGNRNLFAGKDKSLSLERATARLIEEGYLKEGASHSDAAALIKRSLTTPQYTATGTETAAQSAMDAQFDDYLALQEEAAQNEDFDPFASMSQDGFTPSDIDMTGYDELQDPIKLEVNALLAKAEALGIDASDITEQAYENTRNGSEQDYYEAARAALAAAIEGGNRSGRQDSGETGNAGEQAGLTEPSFSIKLGAGQNTLHSNPQFQEAQAQAKTLPQGQYTRITIERAELYTTSPAEPTRYGAWVSNGDSTATFVDKPFPASREPLTGADIAALHDAATLKDRNRAAKIAEADQDRKELIESKKLRMGAEWTGAQTYVAGKTGITTFSTSKITGINEHGFLTVESTLRGSGKVYKFTVDANSRLFDNYPTAEGLTAPTRADILAQQERTDNAQALDDKAQIDAEASRQTITQQTAPEQRSDTSGDMFAMEKAQAEIDQRNAGVQAEKDPNQSGMFDEPAPEAAPEAAPQAKTPSAAELRAQADLQAALADLGDIFGKNTRLNMMPEQEAKILPVMVRLFDAAFRLGYIKFKDAARFTLDKIRASLGNEAANDITLEHLQGAYISMSSGKTGVDGIRAVSNIEAKSEIESHTAQTDNERNGESNAASTNPRVERDRQKPAAEPAVGDSVSYESSGTAGRAGPTGGQATGGTGGRQQDGSGVPFGSAPVAGERGDQRLRGGVAEPELAVIIAGADFSEPGGDSGIAGVPPESIAASQVDAAADQGTAGLKAGIKRARADKAPLKLGDIDSIRATLPQLLPGQQDDVLMAENRFADPKGYGMLFTNGTGTGKTFTGLGAIKRHALQGKNNILIAAPDDKIASDWIESGKLLGLDISKLADTKDAGQGIVITTYANLGENDMLATRQWDLVVADEAHSLMQAADGKPTGYLQAVRALTYHPDGAGSRHAMLNRDKLNRSAELRAQINANNSIINNQDTMDVMVQSLGAENTKLHAEQIKLNAELSASMDAMKAEVTAKQGAARPRLVALSATPFSYEKTIDWANGYLFEYTDGYPHDPQRAGLNYNQPDPREYYFQTRFGYSMRFNKLTQPSGKIDSGMLQRQWNGELKKTGALSGRMLDVVPDYDRRFVLVDSAIGNRIDEALAWLTDQRLAAAKGDGGFGMLSDAINNKFKYLEKRYLLEAIKATEVIPIVKQHMAMGRKVVVFHDYKKGGGFNPFRVNAGAPLNASAENVATIKSFNAAVAAFNAKFGDLVNAPLGSMPSPIDVFNREIPAVLLINGDQKAKDLLARYKSFQDDSTGPQVMLVQSAKNKGWSGHDTTGKHQRVLINLGQPTAPTLAIQQEGRIYRTGQASDAIMRYLNTGTNWERWTFASTIASRASTAENLGMGEMARALKDSFIQSFEESDAYPPGHEQEGKGGKERDKAANNALTEFDRAKTHYWATQKKNSRTRAQEGADYFATPEPLGLKMVQWLDARSGEDLLEPSGGHGAIARWLPEKTNKTAIEPSLALRSRLAMVMNVAEDRIIDGTFEDHAVVNKYDGIVMNPPFGSGGRTAVDHIAKAATHLRDGGRIVALLPTGPAADKKFDQWFFETSDRPARSLATHDTLGKIFKGDTLTVTDFMGRRSKIVVERIGTGSAMQKFVIGKDDNRINIDYVMAVEPTGKRTETFSPAAGLQLIASIKLPQVTFERAGTAVATRIVVIEKTDGNVMQRDRDLSDITDINDLFDRLENMDFPARPKVDAVEVEAPAKAEKPAKSPKQSVPVAEVGSGITLGNKSYPVAIYTTNAGKELRGVWVGSKAEALQYGPSTFEKKGLGFFVRERDFQKVEAPDAPAMSRGRPAFSRGAQAQATESVEKLVNAIKAGWDNAPEIIVAFDMQDGRIPDRVRQEDLKQRSGGAAGTPEGFYYAGKVYLMSPQLATPNDVARVLFHETLGHFGLRGHFGGALKPILQQIVTFRRALVDAKIKEYGLRSVNNLDRLTAAEEVLAEMAQNTPELGFVKRAIAAIRNWLRTNVPGFSNLKMTDADIVQQFILPARAFVERGGNTPEPSGSRGRNTTKTAFARGDDAVRVGDVFRAPTGEAVTVMRALPGGKVEVRIQGKRLRLGDFTNNELKAWEKIGRAEYADGIYTTPQSLIDVAKNEPAGPDSGGASSIGGKDADPTESTKVQSGIEGKSLIDAARFIQQTGSPAQAAIAKQVVSKLDRLQSSGVSLRLVVAHRGDSVPASMGTGRGYTETGFDAKGRDITVWVGGADIAGRVGTDYETVLHELVHAATMGVVQYGRSNPNSLAGKQVKDLSAVTSAISSHIIERFNQADNGKVALTEFEKDMRAGANNAFRGADEVLTWALTNPEAQTYLESIQYKNATLWTKLVQSIRTLLGLSPAADTALSEVLRVAENLMASDLNDGSMQAFWHKRGIRMSAIQAKNNIVLKGSDSYQSENPDIRFSRSMADTLHAAANNVRDVKLPAGYMVADLINATPGKLNWWHKTVGTQYNLAQRSAPFKRVFDSVQNFLNDVSFFATESADLAPNILPKLESWKDIAKSPLSPADTKAISAPIFEGTLIWARDESGKPVKMEVLEAAAAKLTVDQKSQRLLRGNHLSQGVLKMWRGLPLDQYEALINGKYESDMLKAGIVFTDTELKSMFGLTDKQIPLYREFRAATDKSLGNLAIADMLRFGGKDVAPIREQVLVAKDVTEAANTLADYLRSLTDLDPERAAVLTDAADKMIDKGGKAADLMKRGYAPLSRFGQYTLDVVHNGERVYFGMFENRFDAAKMNRQMQAEYPGATISQGTVSEQAYKMFAGVSPETLELFGDMLGLEATGDGAANEAFQTYLKLAKSSRSSMKRLIQRKGIAGFNEDAGRVLAGFVYSNARQTASSLHMGEMTQAATDKAAFGHQGELQDAAAKLVDYIKNPQEEAQAFRGMLFAQYIGGSIASAMVNTTQPLTMTFPWLAQFGGVTSAAKQMAAAVNDAGKPKTGDAALDAALKRAEEDGTVSPQEVHQLLQQAQGRGALQSGDGTTAGNAMATASNTLSRITLAWGKPFSWAEQFNRRSTFIAAYRTAVAQGMTDPDAFARRAISETQGIYNKGNKPAWARGALGGVLFTFKQYSISYVEMLSRMAKNGPEGKRAALLALGVLFLLSGAGGMPGADDLDDLISGALQSMGYNFDSRSKRQAFFAELFGEGGAQFLERGVSGLPGVPIDVSGRMGLGNLIPGTGLFTKKPDHTRDVVEFAGPGGDLVKRGFDAAGKLITGNVGGAMKSIAPKALQNVAQAYDMANMGMYRDAKGMKVLDSDGTDALMKAVGFQPNDVKRSQDASFEVQRMIGLNRMTESEIANRWALGLFEKDQAKVQAARDDLAEWNRINPESQIRIKFGQVAQRVKKMNETKQERIMKTSPKEIRNAVREELAASR